MGGKDAARRLQGLLMLMAGCCGNVLALEFIARRDPGSVGGLVTLAGYLFVATTGLIGQWQWPFGGLKPRSIPLMDYAKLAAIFWIQAVLNNAAIACNISIPMHSVFRSSSLAGSMFAGWCFYRKRYGRRQVIACLLVSLGISLATLADHWLKLEAAQQLAQPLVVIPANTVGSPGSGVCCGDPFLELYWNQSESGDFDPAAVTGLDSSCGFSLNPVVEGEWESLGGDCGSYVAHQRWPQCPLGMPSMREAQQTVQLNQGSTGAVPPPPQKQASASEGGSNTVLFGMLTLSDPALWFLGVLMLVAGLMASSMLGHMQSNLFSKYGPAVNENLFYTHLLGLPMFASLAPEVWARLVRWAAEPPVRILELPDGRALELSLFALLAVNLVSQLLCVRGVFVFQSVSTAVSTALAVTARKAVSLVVSVWWFRNPFSLWHWLGSALVFAGVLLYSWEPSSKQSPKQQQPPVSASPPQQHQQPREVMVSDKGRKQL